MGKGSTLRPRAVSKEEWDRRFEETFSSHSPAPQGQWLDGAAKTCVRYVKENRWGEEEKEVGDGNR